METQVQIRHNAQEIQDYVRDLYEWESDMKRKEKGKHGDRVNAERSKGCSLSDLQQRNLATASGEGEYAEDTTRSTKKTRRDIDLPLRTRNTGSETAAGHTYEYASKKWDKFDVEAALAALSDESDTENKKTAVKGHQSNGERSNPYIQEVHRRKLDPKSKGANSGQAPSRLQHDAGQSSPTTTDDWKAEGNRLFKSGKYEDAVKAYTRSIELGGGSVVYANRAMALLKVNDNQRAEEDCTKTIELDNTFIKAWQRRGAARKAMGRYHDAVEDLEYALRLCPSSKAIRDEFLACVDQLRRQENVSDTVPTVVLLVQDEAILSEVQSNLDIDTAGSSALEVVCPVQSSSTNIAEPPDGDNRTALPGPGQEGTEATQLALNETATLSGRTEGDTPCLSSPLAKNTSTTHAVCSVSKPVGGHGMPVSSLDAPVRLPPAPKTGIEFEAGWKGIRSGPSKSAYLKLLQPSSLPALLKCSMTSPLLMDLMLTILEHTAFEAPDCASEILQSLSKVPRFNLALLGLTRKQKDHLKSCWDVATDVGKDSALREIRALYKL